MTIEIVIMECEINTFVVKVARVIGYLYIWKVLNMADRLSLSDTDERVVVIKKQLNKLRVGVAILIQELKLKGLTTGPKWSSIGISNRKDNNENN